MELIVITHPTSLPNEAQIITDLFQNGLRLLHLRKPSYPEYMIEEYLQAIPKEFHKKIVLHDHHHLSLKYKVGGIHFTKKHRKNFWGYWIVGKYYQLMRPKITLSTTLRNLEQLTPVFKLYSYIFLSPIYDSISKENYHRRFNINEIRENLPDSKYPVVALGGISSKNILEVEQMGFDGAAILGSLWRSNDPIQTYLDLREKLFNSDEANSPTPERTAGHHQDAAQL